MISLESKDWDEAWRATNIRFVTQPNLTIDQRTGTRAFSIDNEIVILNNVCDTKIQEVGYTDFKAKLFDHNYIKAGELERVVDLLRERVASGKPYTIVSYGFEQNKAKHTMGSCVINILIYAYRVNKQWVIEFEINMRIAEVTRRLLVDFIKFQEILEVVLEVFPKDSKYIITFRSKVLYAQPLASVLAEIVFDVNHDKEHWYHNLVRKQHIKFENPNYRFKMGKRIRNKVKILEALKNEYK